MAGEVGASARGAPEDGPADRAEAVLGVLVAELLVGVGDEGGAEGRDASQDEEDDE